MRIPPLLLYRFTLAVAVAIGLWGLLLALFPLQPFWIDEWRLIYNLKFSNAAELWRPLKYTQQFPRVYLVSLKEITETFQYSYSSLRLPAWFISMASILLSWRLMQRIFPQRGHVFSLLFVLIIFSSQTFIDYLVQTKHYEAEIFLALLALWQALELRTLSIHGFKGAGSYILLCLSMAIAPFFSYTYPIAVSPVLLLVGIQCLLLPRDRSMKRCSLLLLPLLMGMCGIVLFYYIDVRQLMNDQNMHHYWAYRMAQSGLLKSLENLWYFFAYLGAGAIFEIVCGALGVAAFIYGLWKSIASLGTALQDRQAWLRAYAVLLVFLVIALFLAGKLPLGEAKFTAFCIPALSLLLVFFLQSMHRRFGKPVFILGGVLYAAMIGNIASVIYNSFSDETRQQRRAIYYATQGAIIKAQSLSAPILVTPEVAWPDLIVHKVPFLENMGADAILKTYPAYDVAQALPVYPVQDTAFAGLSLPTVPRASNSVLVGGGINYRLVQLARQ
jgi:hypothetical protein